MNSYSSVAIVGAGNLAKAFAVELQRAGYRIHQVVSRSADSSRRRATALARKVGARTVSIERFQPEADVIWLCVPDREIAACARILASPKSDWTGKVVLHPSGSMTSEELYVLHKLGAHIASAHPLMTFVRSSRASFKGVPFAVEGDRPAVRVARQMIARLGGRFFAITRRQKAAYHTWATLTSPMLTALLAVAEEVAGLAGVSPSQARARMAPILRETVENYAKFGAAAGFSGPIVRGDVATVEKHLHELQPSPTSERVYRALASAALELLPAKKRPALKRALARIGPQKEKKLKEKENRKKDQIAASVS